MNKKLLIVGGTGFIGGHLVDEALKKKFKVFVIHKKNRDIKKLKKNVKYLQCDLSNKKKLKDLISKKKFQYVINASGYIDHVEVNDIISSHLIGVHNLISILNENKYIKKFIQLSTSDVYAISKVKKKENSPLKPNSIYSYSKLSTEIFLKTLFNLNNFPFVCYRIFLCYGSNQKNDRLIPYIISSALDKKPINILHPSQERDFIHIDEISKVIISSLTKRKLDGKIINLASGKGTKISTIVRIICNYIGFYEFKLDNKNVKKISNMKLVADISKARRLMRWQPKNCLKKDLEKTINQYKKYKNEN